MPGLLKIKKDYSWDLNGIEFAIKERIVKSEYFIGRKKEMEYLYSWYQRVKEGGATSIAFLGRRKIGKSLMMQRLYNIIYSEHDGVIPFYYEFKKGKITAYNFAEDFIVRFFMQVIAYYTKDISWVRQSMNGKLKYKINDFLDKVETIDFLHKDKIIENMGYYKNVLKEDQDAPYELIKLATSIPDAFASEINVNENVLQIIDEFQYLNSEVDAGAEKVPSKCYMSIAESRDAPLLVTGSLMGVITYDLVMHTPQRFDVMKIPKMTDKEVKSMIRYYGNYFNHCLTEEIVDYIVSLVNNVPGRIFNLLETNVYKSPNIKTIDDVDQSLYYEAREGKIKSDWYEYLSLAMDRYNDQNMKLITYYLCKNEGEYYYPYQLKEELGLDLDIEELWRELDILYKYDLVEMDREKYGGVFDKTLKYVLMVNFSHILDLPDKDFLEFFRIENKITYLQEIIKKLAISKAKKQKLEEKIKRIQGTLNYEKGKRYELEVLADLIEKIIKDKKGIVTGIKETDFDFTVNYFLKTGEDIDILIESSEIIIAVECKNMEKEFLGKINKKLVDKFLIKLKKLGKDYPNKEIRGLFMSKYGFKKEIKKYLKEKGIPFN